jgi:hypothetical protein
MEDSSADALKVPFLFSVLGGSLDIDESAQVQITFNPLAEGMHLQKAHIKALFRRSMSFSGHMNQFSS